MRPIRSVVVRVVRVGQVEDHRGVWFGPSTVGELALEVDAAVEVQTPVRCDVDVESLVVGRGIDNANISSLHEIVRHDNVFLIRSHLCRFVSKEPSRRS